MPHPGIVDLAQPARLRRSDLPADTTALARFLVGMLLVHDHPEGRMIGRIVETEAYPVGDASGHAFRGQTPRNSSLFLEHGRAYVYFIYGSCYCLNVSSEALGIGGGVLLRAVEPLEGSQLMQRNRRTSRLLDLTRGPGRLAEAFGIDRRHDGLDLCEESAAGRATSDASRLWLATDGRPVDIGVTVRIGLSRETERPLRFYVPGSPFVSGPKRLLSGGTLASSRNVEVCPGGAGARHYVQDFLGDR